MSPTMSPTEQATQLGRLAEWAAPALQLTLLPHFFYSFLNSHFPLFHCVVFCYGVKQLRIYLSHAHKQSSIQETVA